MHFPNLILVFNWTIMSTINLSHSSLGKNFSHINFIRADTFISSSPCESQKTCESVMACERINNIRNFLMASNPCYFYAFKIFKMIIINSFFFLIHSGSPHVLMWNVLVISVFFNK